MKKLVRLLGLVVFNLFLFGVLLEVAGLVYFFDKTKAFYYTSPLAANEGVQHRTSDTVVENYRVHPYFGYVLQPSRLPEAERAASRVVQNNHGFDEPRDFPYRRQHPEELLVGIFGGSVASKLAVFEQRERIVSRYLAEATGRKLEDVTILNFGQGGFKQPQQLLIYSFFRSLGQELDLVINVDGFNEMALTRLNTRNGIDVGMPSVEHVGSLRKVVGSVGHGEDLERLLRVRTSWRDYVEMDERTRGGESWELRFAAGYMIARSWTLVLRKRFNSNVLAMGDAQTSTHEESWFYLADQAVDEPEPSMGDRSREALDLWQSSAQMMHTLQVESGRLYLHFVQPNQYHATGRTYSESERQVAFAESSPYREAIAKRYPLLEAKVPELREAGVAIYAPLDLFDAAEEAVYVDSCCHYTAAGEALLAAAVGEAAGQLLVSEP